MSNNFFLVKFLYPTKVHVLNEVRSSRPLASVTNVPLPPVNPSPSPLVPGSGTGNGSSKGNSPGNSSNVTPFTGDASLHSPFRGIASTLGLGIMIAAAMLVL